MAFMTSRFNFRPTRTYIKDSATPVIKGEVTKTASLSGYNASKDIVRTHPGHRRW